MQGKSTLHCMDQTTLKIGSTHPIWTSLSSTVSSVKLLLLIIGKANVLSIISLTMDDFSLKLEVHLAMPIRDIMNAFILSPSSYRKKHIVEKSHHCANAVERRMKMSLISCYYVLRYTSKEKSHFLN
jgi:hypothetical protein